MMSIFQDMASSWGPLFISPQSLISVQQFIPALALLDDCLYLSNASASPVNDSNVSFSLHNHCDPSPDQSLLPCPALSPLEHLLLSPSEFSYLFTWVLLYCVSPWLILKAGITLHRASPAITRADSGTQKVIKTFYEGILIKERWFILV